MKLNMGWLDRLARIALAAAVGYLYFTGRIDGVTAMVLGAIAVIFLLTSFIGFCPLYAPFRFSTRR